MALRGVWNPLENDTTRNCSSVTERGVVLVKSGAGSGVALGDSAPGCSLVANPSGYKPAGLLLGDVVNIDVTRYHLNFHKNETQVNNRVDLMTKGLAVTNQVTGTPADGSVAYLTTNCQLTPTISSTGGLAATPKVGEFRGSLDENGFVAVYINLP